MQRVKVLALTKYDRNGASSRLRTYQFLPFFEQCNIETTVVPLFDDRFLRAMYAKKKGKPLHFVVPAYLRRIKALLTAGAYDLVWLEKEALPYTPAIAERMLALLGIPYIVDYDDAVFHLYDQHRLSLIRVLLGKKIDTVMAKASLVMAGNEYLAEKARTSGAKRVEIVPTVVDLERYLLNPSQKNKELRIGWIGTPYTVKYLDLIHGPLKEISSVMPIRLVTVGGKAPFDDIPSEFIPWSEDSESASIQSFDFGIMPLVDKPFEKGKCGYKLIQYMAAGKPVIASPVGMNKTLVTNNSCGIVANTDAEWAEAFTMLADAEFRNTLGRNGRYAVGRKYSLHVAAPRLAQLILELSNTMTGEEVQSENLH